MAALQRKTGLGKGLGALLQDDLKMPAKADVAQKGGSEPAGTSAVGSINFIKIDHVAVNPFQPRADFDEEALSELAKSIQLQGLIQPITVRQVGKNQY